jgi:hypothetical protein
MCKEITDPIHGKGKKIEDNMYELDGHVRHFFSKEYAIELLAQSHLVAQNITTGQEIIYDHVSSFIKVSAKKS